MTYKLFFFTFFLFLSPSYFSQNLYFNFKDGTRTQYLRSEIRNVTYVSDSMVLNLKNGNSVSWQLNFVSHFEFTPPKDASLDEQKIEKCFFRSYPNPVKNELTIQYDLDEVSDNKIELLNLTGTLISIIYEGNSEIGSKEITCDISKYTNGLYLIKVSSNKFSEISKVIIDK